MFTKTRKIKQEKNDLGTNHSFSIPGNIKEKIDERGFALYNWIGEQDVKLSIERDFLKLINKIGPWIAVLLIIPSTILILMESIGNFYLLFFGLLGTINMIFIIYIIIIAIKRSKILRQNSQILITDSSISINGRINKLNSFIYDIDLKKIGDLFEEDIFDKSNINKTKKGFLKQISDKLGNGFSFIFNIGKGGNKNSLQLIIILLILYFIYLFSLGIVYFIGIFFIWIFGNILSFINKKILLITGHEITTINNHFENIDKYSERLIKEKEILSNLLNKAIKNDWKDSLLTKINSGIKNINNNASNAINTSIELKGTIEKSKYKKMFNFNIYNSWIKKQILTPLEQIKDLLNTNLIKLQETLKQITIQIKETTDISLSGPLTANKLRIEKKIIDIKKHMKAINIYITKLK